MERYSGKGAAAGTITPKKGCSVGCKSTTTDKDQNVPFCNRIGCSGRLKYSQNQNTKIGSSERIKPPKPSFSTSKVNELPGNSSRAKRPSLDFNRNLPSRPVSSPSTEKTSQSLDSKFQETILPSSSRSLSRHRLGLNSSLPSNITSRKVFHPKPETSNSKTSILRTQNNNKSSSSSSGSSSRSSISTSTSSMYGLRNSKSNSISNNVPPSSSSPESKSAGKSIVKKKLPESGRQKTCVPNISITGSGRSSSSSGDSNTTGGSVRTRRPLNTNNSRTRLNVGGRPHSSEHELRVDVGTAEWFANGTSTSYSPFSSNPARELDFNCLMDHESYNMSGLAEVLLSLERFRQEQGLTREQVRDLDNNLFTHGLYLSDQHRDMRLDIDNMSYEELLALEEKMGSVSTALSDEALFKCIKISIYNVGPPEVKGSGEEGDEITCSICQEGFFLGDETGELVGCQHEYHLMCINQWLQLKNWCPICKASVDAAPQEASPSE